MARGGVKGKSGRPKKDRNSTVTPYQELWAMHFTNLDPDAGTYLNATKAAMATGYSPNLPYEKRYQTCATAGYANTRKPHVMKLVNEMMAVHVNVSEITVDKVLIDLETTRRLAIQKHQYGVARQCSYDQGKYLKMFVDRIEQVQTVDEASTEELAELLSDVLGKLNDSSIDRILAGPSATVSGKGRLVPLKRAAGKD